MAKGTASGSTLKRGFGIQPNSGGKDVLVRISVVERAGLRDLREGQKISYEVQVERGKLSSGDAVEDLTLRAEP
jgi:CspA family cold shock protein